VALYGGMYGLIYNVSATGTMTITVEASSNVSAGAVTAIPFYISRTTTSDNVTTAATRVAATGYTTTAGENATYIISVDLADVQAAGYQYARIVTTEVVDNASTGYCVLLLPNPRYASGALPAAIV
jgi:mannose/fructose/N-acetylgalactosamine-specific phosphotransferase system component IIC